MFASIENYAKQLNINPADYENLIRGRLEKVNTKKKKSGFLTVLMFISSMILFLLSIIAPFSVFALLVYILIKYVVNKDPVTTFFHDLKNDGFIIFVFAVSVAYFFFLFLVFFLHRSGYKIPSFMGSIAKRLSMEGAGEFLSFLFGEPVGWIILGIMGIALILGAVLVGVGVHEKSKKTIVVGIVSLAVAAAIPFMFVLFLITVRVAA
jgi:hypothetical protein